MVITATQVPREHLQTLRRWVPRRLHTSTTLRSSPNSRFQEAALRATQTWRWCGLLHNLYVTGADTKNHWIWDQVIPVLNLTIVGVLHRSNSRSTPRWSLAVAPRWFSYQHCTTITTTTATTWGRKCRRPSVLAWAWTGLLVVAAIVLCHPLVLVMAGVSISGSALGETTTS